MKRYRITLKDQTFDVEVLDDPLSSPVRVRVNGEIFAVTVETPAGPPSTAAPLPQQQQGPGPATVTAPLPGAIKSVAVRPGQRVTVDDELLVIEAMKMDNVIRAQRDGVLGAVHVAAGQQVAYGDPLVEYVENS
ncbi:MAG: acetyl-CoA carboxylase biotin carboxyl carrier protein subunit [Anaerolineae bacterium]|nr:acetyl-CoA carboxylase biotin carboxyl carrier protein subunit [Anaerolineae bacterium]